MERLDKNLFDHAIAAGTGEDGPDISTIYQLGALAERHYYLKVEHPFSPEEVEALLQFTDPLEVAQACWEDNSHPYSFPICELLEEINARGRFTLAASMSASERQSRRMERIDNLKFVLEQNLEDYHAYLMEMSKEAIIDKGKEIVTMQEAYNFMTQKFHLTERLADILLEMEDPLMYIAEHWPTDPSELTPTSSHIWEAIEEAGKNMVFPPEETVPEKTSVRALLQKRAQEVHQRPAQESRPRTDEPR